MDNLSPVELEFIQSCITKLTRQKITPKTTNYENLNPHIECCPICGSTHFVKNGFNPHHRQKYRCKDCHSVFMATTGTLFTHSKTGFEQWAVLIASELNGLTLEAESVMTGLTKTTCFNMRHKLYQAASRIQKDVRLKGKIELDPSYTKINLKGTKRENMPRFSKRRGKHKPVYSRSIRGISGHKICLVTAIDENDNMLFKIAGLGEESLEKLNHFRKHFGKGSLIVSDDKPCIKNFAEANHMESDVVPSCGGQVRFTTKLGNSVASVNELHSEAKLLIRNKRGISTRHLQGYLDWLLFRKKMKYTVEMKKWKSTAYMDLMFERIPFTAADIEKLDMPISLYEAYGSYHFGIFSNIN
jgi:transposase-like protein